MPLQLIIKKPSMTRFFTWAEFDNSVDYISKRCNISELSGIYGVPRGGLCLAVALSHKLNVQIIETPKKDSLIVDDVFETGLTLNKYKSIEGAKFFVLFSKKEPIWWEAVNLSPQKEWIVFPWENKENADNEQKVYNYKRTIK